MLLDFVPRRNLFAAQGTKGRSWKTSLFLHLPFLSTTVGTKSKWRRTAVLSYLDRLEEGNNSNLLKFNEALPIGRKSSCQPHRERTGRSLHCSPVAHGRGSCSTTHAERAAQHKPKLSTPRRALPFPSAHFKHTGKIWAPWHRLALHDYARHQESTRLSVLIHLL